MISHFNGRITREPELRHLPDGTPVLNVNVATDLGYGRNKTSIFVQVAIWGKQGESLSGHLRKGDMYTFHCTLTGVNTFERRDGSTDAQLQFKLDSIEFIPGGGRSNGNDQEQVSRQAPANTEPPF